MKTWSFYRQSDGTFLSQKLRSTSDKMAELNTPAGTVAIEGNFNPRTQRMDLETGTVVDWQAPADSRKARDRIRAQIVALEAMQQRPLRELGIDPNNERARDRLRNLEAAIAALRADL